MTTALKARLDRIIEKAIPTMPADLSQLDRWDRPADTTNTAELPSVASRRPVAATPANSAPVRCDPDKFGPMPSVLPSKPSPWVAAGLAAPFVLILVSVAAFLHLT